MDNNLIITGEFMKLCNVTRNTLIHYDNINLLKPVATNERGDRFYHPFQCYTVYLIKLFQRAEMSLESINNFLSNKEGDVIKVLDEKYEECKEAEKGTVEEYKKTLESYRIVNKMQSLVELAATLDSKGEPVIRSFKLPGGTIFTKLDEEIDESKEGYYTKIFEHMESLSGVVKDGTFPIVTHYRKDSFEKGRNLVTHISTYTLYGEGKRVSEYDDYQCLVMRRAGTIDEIDSQFDEIRRFLNKHPEYEILDYVNVFTSTASALVGDKRIRDRLFLVPVITHEGDGPYKNAPLKFNNEKVDNKVVNPDELLSSGEFLRLSGITRNALNFYEKHGLIKPAFVKENGYKMYGVDQMSIILEVKLLKNAGFSIEKIKEGLKRYTSFVESYDIRKQFLEEQKKITEKKLYELAESKRILCQLRNIIQLLKAAIPDYVHIHFNKNRYYEAGEINSLLGSSMDIYKNVIKESIQKSISTERLKNMPIGIIVDLESNTMQPYNMVNQYKLTADEKKNYSAMQGDYIVKAFSINKSEFGVNTRKLIEKIKQENKWKISGKLVCVFINIRSIEPAEHIMDLFLFVPVTKIED